MANLKKEKHNEKLIFILIAILILTLILNIYFFINFSRIFEVRELYASIIVSDKIGFDLNSTALTFGSTFRGGSSAREINIENSFGFPIEVEIHGKGDMEKFVRPSRHYIDKDEKKSIQIAAFVPEDTEFGKYEGNVEISLIRHY